MKKNTGEGKGLENTDDVFGISISFKLKWFVFPPSLLPFLNNLLLVIPSNSIFGRLFSICETLSDDASLLAQEHARSQSR